MGKLRTREIKPAASPVVTEEVFTLEIDELIEALSRQFEIDLGGLVESNYTDSDIRDFTRDLVLGRVELDSTTEISALRKQAQPIVQALGALIDRPKNGRDSHYDAISRLNDNGLLPLVGLLVNEKTARAIAEQSSMSTVQLFETASTLQEADSDERALQLAELFDSYLIEKARHFIPTQEILHRATKPEVPAAALSTRNVAPVKVRNDSEINAHKMRQLLNRLDKTIEDVSLVRFDASILTHEFFVTLTAMDQGVMDRTLDTLNNPSQQSYSFTNGSLWHASAAFTVALGGMTGEALSVMLVSRCIDIDNECGLLQELSKVLQHANFDPTAENVLDLRDLVNDMDALKNKLADLHRITIAGCFFLENLEQSGDGTTEIWESIITNPIFKGLVLEQPKFETFDIKTKRDLSAVYHLPVPLVDLVLNGQFPGVSSDIESSHIEGNLRSLNGEDFLMVSRNLAFQTDRVKMITHGFRAGYGTPGEGYAFDGEKVGEIQPTRGQTITAMFGLGSVTARYEGTDLNPTSDFLKQLRRLDRWNEIGTSQAATR